MKKGKFLTVFAVFDNETQIKLKNLQEKIFDLGHSGTQTMGIPFHISLGSFSVDCELDLKNKIKETCKGNMQFDITLNKVNHFNNKVLFIEPEVNENLRKLHNLFDNNYADGFPWHAHATIFCGDENQVIDAKNLLMKSFNPIKAKIVGIQMGEFFPTRMILQDELCK